MGSILTQKPHIFPIKLEVLKLSAFLFLLNVHIFSLKKEIRLHLVRCSNQDTSSFHTNFKDIHSIVRAWAPNSNAKTVIYSILNLFLLPKHRILVPIETVNVFMLEEFKNLSSVEIELNQRNAVPTLGTVHCFCWKCIQWKCSAARCNYDSNMKWQGHMIIFVPTINESWKLIHLIKSTRHAYLWLLSAKNLLRGLKTTFVCFLFP